MTNAVNIAQSGSNNVTMRNRIINGAMMIDQRNAGASVAVTTTGVYTVDRFRADINSSGTGRFSVQQSTTAPTGFVNSLQVTVTTADAAPTSNFGYSIQQLIEGFNTADLALGTANAQPVTLSFWVRSSVIGTFPVTFLNEDATRTFGAQYTISAANTWEYKSIAVSGLINGTWLTNNGLGIRVVFGLGGGTNRTASLGYQTTTGLVITNVTGSTQLIATSGATWNITGVQLEEGTAASPFENRLYSTELSLCQRYYLRYQLTASFAFVGRTLDGNRVQLNFPLRNQMRTSPSLISSGITAVNNVYFGTSIVSPNGSQTYGLTGHESVDIGGILIEGGGTYTGGQISTAQISGSIAYSAEL